MESNPIGLVVRIGFGDFAEEFVEATFFDVQLSNAELLVLTEAGHLLAEFASFALGGQNAGFDAVVVGADDFDFT